MADVTAPSVQTSVNPADAAATAPATAPIHDQQVGPSQSPPDVSFPDDTKNTITADLRAKALKAAQEAQTANDPSAALHKKLDKIVKILNEHSDMLHELIDNTAHDEATEEDNDFVADDDEDVEAEDDEDEEEEAMETGDEAEDEETHGTKRDTAEDVSEVPAAQRRKSRRV